MSTDKTTGTTERKYPSPLLDRIALMLIQAEKLQEEIEQAGQYVAGCAFDDVIDGLRKTKGVWNYTIPPK